MEKNRDRQPARLRGAAIRFSVRLLIVASLASTGVAFPARLEASGMTSTREGKSVASTAGATVFAGGNLEDLQALSPTLTFEHLVITGSLRLPLFRSVTLNVGSLTVTSEGGVRIDRDACDYGAAPDLEVLARDRVVIEGNIQLRGVSGDRTSNSSTCNSCYGRDGGDIHISASEVVIRADLVASGGSGSTNSSSNCNSGCSAGAAGAIRLDADRIQLLDAGIYAYGGRGGRGTCYGGPSNGADGDPGAIELIALELSMSGGAASTDGAMQLHAGRTEIYGRLGYGSLDDLIAGMPDQSPPRVQIVSPQTGGTVQLDRPLELSVRVGDTGTGVRKISVTGLGIDETVDPGEVRDGLLRVTVPQPFVPASLIVTAHDNKGRSTTARATDLVLAGTLSIEEGRSVTLDEPLDLGPEADVVVHGEMLLPRGGAPSIVAGSLTLADGARIGLGSRTEESLYEPASLSIRVSGTAVIDGVIDLGGAEGIRKRDHSHGEHGRSFVLSAHSIDVGGEILTDGGNGVYFEFGFPVHFGSGAGGRGGSIRLEAATSIRVEGTLSARGGTPENGLGPCHDGQPGGEIELVYASEAELQEATVRVSGAEGDPFGRDCPSPAGASGTFSVEYVGAAVPEPIVELDELEPNNHGRNPQAIPHPVRVSGNVTPHDNGAFTIQYTDTISDDFEDLYLLRLDRAESLTIRLDPDAVDIDMDLLLVDSATLTILAESIEPELGGTEQTTVDLQPGSYLILVSQFGDSPAAGSDYTLTATAAGRCVPGEPGCPCPDLDGDGHPGCDSGCSFPSTPGACDCDDRSPAIYPGANEVCNLLDDDCDAVVDEGFDVDADGYTVCAGDCDDGDPDIHFGAAEACGNSIDEDCDGADLRCAPTERDRERRLRSWGRRVRLESRPSRR